MGDFERLFAARQRERITNTGNIAAQSVDEQPSWLDIRAQQLGLEAAGLLLSRGVPRLKIYEPRVVGQETYKDSGRSGVRERVRDVSRYFATGEGWHVLTDHGSYDDGYGARVSRTGLDTLGRLLQFDMINGKPYLPGNQVTGIMEPRIAPPEVAVAILESPDFMDGIADLVAGRQLR